MNAPTQWKILNKYDFELLPGEETSLPGGVKSYYHYLNEEPHETGKNVQIISWLMRDIPAGLTLFDPFGGVGVFAVAALQQLKPTRFFIGELDDGCVAQLKHTFAGHQEVKVFQADARLVFENPSHPRADVYLCDFPRFTLMRHMLEQRWAPELAAMFHTKPAFVITSDGSAHLNHFVRRAFKKRGHDVGDSFESFVAFASKYFYDLYGYSIRECGYHGNCFYYRFEPGRPAPITFLRIPAGSYKEGLRRT
jgi:hypothetical protein